MERYDVCIIGGGILGCLTALELSRLPLSCLLVEKNGDCCLGISKANSAVLYPGYDHKPGTMKSRFAIEGNRRTAEVCAELGIPVRRCGSLMAACGEAGQRVLWKKYRQGIQSGIPGLLMLEREEALKLEPGLSPEVTAALSAPNTAVVYPWRLGMAAAGKARKAGVETRFHTKICGIRREGECGDGYILTTEKGEEFSASCVVNAAGIFAHQIRELLFEPKIRIRPSMADYLVFGKEENPGLSHVIFYEPEDGEKGITLIPNLNGTILAGATDRQMPQAAARAFSTGSTGRAAGNSLTERDRAADGAVLSFAEPEHATDGEGLRFLRDRTKEIFPALSEAVPIRSFAGLRPNPYEVIPDLHGGFCDSGRSIHSFVIEKEVPDGSFISLLGIKTPGITASVPIAVYVAGIIAEICREKTMSVPVFRHTDLRTAVDGNAGSGDTASETTAAEKEPALMTAVNSLSLTTKQRLSAKDPSCGNIVCRCELVTEREIREAARCGAKTAEGVKLRCGAGMGRCQGTRCRSLVEKILEEEKTAAETAFVPENKLKTVAETAVVPENKLKTAAETAVVPENKLKTALEETISLQEPACDYLLVGAGVAGLSLALELSKKDSSADILLVDREDVPGGVLIQCLHDGFPEFTTGKMMTGPDYLDQLWEEVRKEVQAGRIRCLFSAHVTELREEVRKQEEMSEREGDRSREGIPEREIARSREGIPELETARSHPVTAVAATGRNWIRIRSRYGILTSGALERTAGMLLIPGTRPQGVYTAGEVQRMLNLEGRLPGRRAVLVGTGNMGLIMADLMIRKGMEVVRILEKEDSVTAAAGNVRKYITDLGSVIGRDRFRFRSEVGQIHGTTRLQGVTIKSVVPDIVRGAAASSTGDLRGRESGSLPEMEACGEQGAADGGAYDEAFCGAQEYLECDTLVIAAGLIPDRQLLKESPPCCRKGAERIFLFGNCEHIYTSVSAMRIAAEEMAGKLMEVKEGKSAGGQQA